MSTLKNLVAERRAAAISTGAQFASSPTQSPALLVHKWDTQSWVFPWSYFIGAQHEVGDEGELLTLSFSFREIVIQGRNLDLLLADIASCRLEALRELPEKYREMVDDTQPAICGITIRPVGENR